MKTTWTILLPGGGGGVGSFGGGSGEGVSLNLKKYKRLKSSVTLHASKTAKHRNYVHCRIRDCKGMGVISTHLFLAESPVLAGRPGEADSEGFDFQR